MSQTEPDSGKTAGFVHVHTHIGDMAGVIIELRPEKYDLPSERDMIHLSDQKALELYHQLAEYLNVDSSKEDKSE